MRSGVVSLDCTDAEVRHSSRRPAGGMTPHPPPRSRPPSARSSRPRPSALPHRPAPAAPHADSCRHSAGSARRPFSAHPPTSAERAQLAPRPVSAREPRHTLMKKVSFMHEKTRSAACAPERGASEACVVESLDGLEAPGEESSPTAGPRALRRLKSGWHAPLKPHDLLDEMQLTEDQLPAEVKRAVSSFDARHKRHVTRADALLERLSRELTWERASQRYEQQLSEIRRNRYFVHEVYNPFPAAARSNSFVRRKRWKISDSVWKNRPKSNKSDDYFETTSALRQLFMNDWSVAKDSHNLSRFILQSGEADAQEVEHVREGLWKHCRTIYGIFDYFAVLMSNSADLGGEPDIYNISFTAYLEFCRVGQLGHKRDLPSSELELIWVSVNSEDKKVKERDSFNKQRYLNQQEFLQVIVRVAIARFVRSGKCTKPADAVDLLCHQHLLPLMPKECHHISNNFRSTYCYIPNMDPIIRRHMVTLQSIFRRYSDGDQKHELMSNSALSIGEWLSFLEDLGLAGVEARGAKNVSDTEAKLIFLWSRIRASTSSSITTYVRLRHLYWEDFLEAMVRLAAILALPTDMEIEHSEAADAGEFLLSLRANSETEYMRFVQKTKGSFFQEPRQKIWRCFDHMMMLLVRTIEGNTSRQKYGEADNVVTEKEASQFFQKRRSGLSLMRLQSMGDSLDGSNENLAKDLLQTLELSQQKLLNVLKKISIFDKLDEDQLITLRDAMVEAPFQAGDIVFEQGDASDSLYVVLEGTFEVLVSQECLSSYPEPHVNRMRWKTTKPDSEPFAPLLCSAQGDGDGEHIVAKLGEGSSFGELAMIEDTPRPASIRCKRSARTMSITREMLERSLGSPLKDLVPRLRESSQLRDLIDTNHDNLLSLEEFRMLMNIIEKKNKYSDEQLREHFSTFDLDGSGFIDLNEYDHFRINRVLRNNTDNNISFAEWCQLLPLYVSSYQNSSEAEMRVAFDQLDLKGTGYLSLKAVMSYFDSLRKAPATTN